MTNWLVNGQRHGAVAPDDRGLAYGDGLFETIALRGGEFRFIDYHFERLDQGCRQLGLPPPDRAQLTAELTEAAAGLANGTAKIILTRGVGPRGYRPPPAVVPTRLVGAAAVPGNGPAWRAGIRVRLCSTPVSENPVLAGLKTLNRLEQVLARAEWNEPEVVEGLMMTVGGEVICGTMSNVFLIRGGAVLTPALDRCGVRGVMRRVVMDAARHRRIEVRVVRLRPSDLHRADEVFVSNSQHGIGPVIAIDDRSFAVGAVTRELMATLAARGVSECGAG